MKFEKKKNQCFLYAIFALTLLLDFEQHIFAAHADLFEVDFLIYQLDFRLSCGTILFLGNVLKKRNYNIKIDVSIFLSS